MPPSLIYPAEREASDFFNSLPREHREKLHPLLEHYRLLGMAEAHREMRDVLSKVDARMTGIVARAEADALSRNQRGPKSA